MSHSEKHLQNLALSGMGIRGKVLDITGHYCQRNNTSGLQEPEMLTAADTGKGDEGHHEKAHHKISGRHR